MTSNVSGQEGTQITPDQIIESSITSNSALVSTTLLKIGKCHNLLGYGHVWSFDDATPSLSSLSDFDFTDNGVNANFNDDFSSNMLSLMSNTKYYVRAWVAVENADDPNDRILFYSDKISSFETLP